MKYYIKALQNYANFNGRSRRKEYWNFVLFNILFGIAAIIVDIILGTSKNVVGYGTVYMLYTLAVLLPGIAVAVRRLHDIGKSGWWILISLVPIIGGIWLIVLLATDSEPIENEYGPNPKALEMS